MLKIKVIPKEYTRTELKKIFVKETGNHKNTDFDEFISAMQKTGQIIQTGNKFIPTKQVELKTPKRKIYKTLDFEKKNEKNFKKGVEAKEDSITVFRWTKKPRIAFRAGKEWVDKHGTPVKIKLLKIYKDGKEIKIPRNEQPTITTTKSPRYPKTIEAYRSEIPAEIVKKYNLKGNEKIRVRIDRLVKNYISYLELYGYQIDVMTFFGETGNASADQRHRKGIRDMEMQGTRFTYETKGDITNEFRKRGDKALNVTQAWLEQYDEGYSLLYGYSKRKDIAPPNEGARIVPLIEKPEDETSFRLRDIEKDHLKLEVRGKLPDNWPSLSNSAILVKAGLYTVTDNRTGSRNFGGRKSYQSSLDNSSGF